MNSHCGKWSTWSVTHFDCCPPSRRPQWCYGFYVTHQQGHTGFELFFKTRELKKKWFDQFEMAMWVCWHTDRTIVPTAGTYTSLFAFVCMRGIPRLRGVDSFICAVWSGLSCNQAHTVGKSTIALAYTDKRAQTQTAPRTINTAVKRLCLCVALHTRLSTGISMLLSGDSGSFFSLQWLAVLHSWCWFSKTSWIWTQFRRGWKKENSLYCHLCQLCGISTVQNKERDLKRLKNLNKYAQK